jgi:indole-3-glycerol phosphate synthase
MSRLTEIFDHKRREVAERKAAVPLSAVIRDAAAAPPPLDFSAGLRAQAACPGTARFPALIAEIKAKSPSRGRLAGRNGRALEPVHLARIYAQNGAAAISVLTDAEYFGGSLDRLRILRAALPAMPLLCKDFIYDQYQVYEARAAGADAVLLILAGLDLTALADLAGLADSLGMEALVEVHTAEELDAALASGLLLIGINNRNLHDFSVRLETTLELAPKVPDCITLVSESGVFTAADVARLTEGRGVDAILVGEALVTAGDTAAAVRELSGREMAGCHDR